MFHGWEQTFEVDDTFVSRIVHYLKVPVKLIVGVRLKTGAEHITFLDCKPTHIEEIKPGA
jgi:hypothetical protein